MDGLTDLVDERTLNGFGWREWTMPQHSIQVVGRCRSLCAENKCGHYDTNWGCPPGFNGDIGDYLGRFTRAFMIKKRFEVDIDDSEAIEAITRESQETVRNVMTAIRSKGIDCQGFSDGGCRYCGICAYPEPCRFPEALVPSISAVGIDMGDYAKANGEEFSFERNAVTLYGLLLV